MNLLSTNWYNVFYWITRADSVKEFFDTSSNIFSVFAGVLFVALAIISIATFSSITENNSEDDDMDDMTPDIRSWKKMRKYVSTLFYIALTLSLITWTGYVFTPTKKDALLIIAGGSAVSFLTTDSSAKQIPHELSSFVVTELKNMAKEAQVDLGIASQKDRILEEAKKMTSEQVMERMRIDTTFAKIILNK